MFRTTTTHGISKLSHPRKNISIAASLPTPPHPFNPMFYFFFFFFFFFWNSPYIYLHLNVFDYENMPIQIY